MNDKQLAVASPQEIVTRESVFNSMPAFKQAMEIAKELAGSDLIPATYRSKPANIVIAMDLAQQRGVSVFNVMQNMTPIQGNPFWSATYTIGAINRSGRYTTRLRFEPVEMVSKTVTAGGKSIPNAAVRAYAIERDTNERVHGPTVSMEMAVKEGWYTKNGSKWQSMPEVMLNYRAATFFARVNCPEILEGINTEDEMIDMGEITPHDAAPQMVQPAEKPKRTRKIKKDDPDVIEDYVIDVATESDEELPPMVQPKEAPEIPAGESDPYMNFGE